MPPLYENIGITPFQIQKYDNLFKSKITLRKETSRGLIGWSPYFVGEVMGHCKEDEIADLNIVFREILKWDKIIEKGNGRYYLKSRGFLHFHSKDGRRWADVRDGEDWGSEIDIPFYATKNQKIDFIKEVKKRYINTL